MQKDDSMPPEIHHLHSRIRVDQSCGDALRAMDTEALDFIPIVDDDGRLAGVALRPGIENGCWGMGHDPDRCRVRNHMKAEVATCFVREAGSEQVQSRMRSEPVVVVVEGMVPVGVIVARG